MHILIFHDKTPVATGFFRVTDGYYLTTYDILSTAVSYVLAYIWHWFLT